MNLLPPHNSTPDPDRRRQAWAMATLALAVLLAYAGGFSGVFVLDDEPSIVRNPTIRDLWALGEVLCPPTDSTVGGRPVANLTFAVNHALGGLRVWGYHAGNILVHLLASLALFGVVRRTLARVAGSGAVVGIGDRASDGDAAVLPAFAVSILWALHPLQTAAVSYVVQRVESLMGLFFLLTFYCFIRSCDSSRSRLWQVSAVVACLLGMGTKEVMAVVPLLVLLYDRTFLAGTFRRAWAARRWLHLAMASTWIPLALLVAGTGGDRGGTVGFDVGVEASAYWSTQFEAVARYLALSFWPDPLVFDRAMASARNPWAIGAFALPVVALAAATLWALRYRPMAGFLGACFFAILAPTSVVPSAEQFMAEHRMYLPLAAVGGAVVLGVRRWAGNRGVFALLALVPVLMAGTAARNRVYRSDRLLWSDTVVKCPGNDRAHNNLGNVLAREGEVEGAILCYRAALRIRPDAVDTNYNLGNALQQAGRFAEAIASYERALAGDAAMPDALTALGGALERTGRRDEAIGRYEEALRVSPDFAEAHDRLGIALAEKGRLAAAVAHFEQSLRLVPASASAEKNLGRALAAMDRLPEAIAHFERAAALVPSAPEVHGELGALLMMADRVQEGIVRFEESLRLEPNQPQIHLYLGIALQSVGREREAAAHLDAARRQGLSGPGAAN